MTTHSLRYVEITENNTIQVCYLDHIESDIAASERMVRFTCDSTDDLETMSIPIREGVEIGIDPFIKSVAGLFPYCGPEKYLPIEDQPEPTFCADSACSGEGRHTHVSFIRIAANEQYHICYNLIEHNFTNGRSINSSGPIIEVGCLEDTSGLHGKIQTVAALIFTPEVKAAYIARLPTVDVKVAGKTTTETVKVPAVTEKQVVDGVLTDVVIEEAREEEREVQATQAFIQYKGELYASARDLL